MNWKLSLDYVDEGAKFVLSINGVLFLMLPFKDQVSSLVSMNISNGIIKLNDEEVMKVEHGKDICQWTPDLVEAWYDKTAAYKQHTTEIELIGLGCSSSNMVNTLIDMLGRTINTKHGLKKLRIENFADKNSL